MSDEKTALVLAQQQAMVPSIWDKVQDPIQAIERVGSWLAKSGMFGIRNQEQGYIVAITCLEERITPLEFKKRYHIIDGVPSKRSDRMHADFLARGGAVDWVESTGDVAEAVFSHPKLCPKGRRVRITLKEMSERGINKGKDGVKANWRRFPEDMLAARCLSRGIRRVDPGCVAGEYTPEEIGDLEGGYIDVEAVAVETVNDAPTTPAGEAPSGATNGKAAKDHSARVKKVVAAFAAFGVMQSDLELLCGNQEEGVIEPCENWKDVHFKMLQAAHDQIKKSAPGEERAALVRRMFCLPSDAVDAGE